MKQLFIMLLLITQNSCSSQNKKESRNNQKKIDTMKTFNIDVYKDWEIDTDWLSNENDKHLKKGNERIRIICHGTIQVEKNDITTPYKYYYVYDSKSKLLTSYGKLFILLEIGKWSYYDENGKLIKEIDFDKPYKFSISDLINKFNKEYNLDLEKPKTVFNLYRYEEKEYLNIPIYEVGINKDAYSSDIEYYLVDGNNGKTLYSIKIAEGEIKSPLNEYIKQVKKQKEEDNAYYRTYKGKDYTKKEWEIFEEEWHKNYEQNKNKGFWDDIFPQRKK
ncbi:hypothetical protein HYN56_07055 [Flavobacterium crocinum]|uniref:Uncharacterized protein n=1 Tax=Flavobacterium crocinum TaxID=2183896 RepID=A0A2S1YIW0_9FLAO|nr:hypothetical protein [Flavobacterium crocinum]AWK04001.1 hypothetical protein HYN56_07055 [Flavobacterium crocinum]